MSSGDEAGHSDDSNCSEEGSRVLRVETLHISSPILAAKSPFFYKVLVVLICWLLMYIFLKGLIYDL